MNARRARALASVRSEASYAASLLSTALTALHAGDVGRARASHHELRFCLHRLLEVVELEDGRVARERAARARAARVVVR